jgi:hypothetical protein
MKKTLALLALSLSVTTLAACVDDGYGYGGGVAYGPGPYAYDGWYDGAYGPIYDGYWGSDNYFYYRHGAGIAALSAAIAAISCARRRRAAPISSASRAI